MAECAAHGCVHEWFEAQVKKSPGVVEFGGRRWTGRELNARANGLARLLRRRGVGPEVPVGIFLERSFDLLTGLLAVLKAGGAYVPLDPAFPRDRLAYMLADSGAPVVLTEPALCDLLPGDGVDVLCPAGGAAAEPDANDLDARVTPDHLAYVIYTSGSTGRPKGVEVTHRSVVNLLRSMQRQPGLSAHDTLAAVTTLSFDIAGLELFLPLVTGARLLLLDRRTASDGEALARALAAGGVTVLQATPATWRLLIDAGWRGDRRLRMLCGGEALPRDLAGLLRGRGGSLWNVYGPTETTIWSTCQRIEDASRPVSIGRPIDRTEAYVLGPDGRPVPEGESGELCIGGAGLARGYRGRPDLTAERFVPDPFSGRPGSRLYRTGDLARRLPDGTLECLGRIDHQVKVNGFPIELGDVEAALAEHPAVRQAVAVAREDVPGRKRLVAYVVAADGAAASPDELRRFVSAKLPDYMVPHAFVRLDALPLTPNGKVDRKALPAPPADRSQAAGTYVAPRDRVERRLMRLWEKTLGIRPISVLDNVFELGASSLDAARLSVRIEKAFGRRLPPAPLYQAPTVARLGDLIRRNTGSAYSSLVAIQPSGSLPPFFCVHGGLGTVFGFYNLARHLGPEQPFYGLQMQGLHDLRLRRTTVPEMAEHYLGEIRRRQPHGPYLLGGYCFGGLVAFEMARQLCRQGEEVAALVLLYTSTPAYARRWPDVPPRGASGEGPVPELGDGARRPAARRVREMLGWRLRLFRRTAGRVAGTAARVVLPRFRLPPPESIRMSFFAENNARAGQAYQPERYPGSMVLFGAAGLRNDPFLGWRPLVAGEIEVHRLADETRGRADYLTEPLVRQVARQLEECLRATRSGGPGAAVSASAAASVTS